MTGPRQSEPSRASGAGPPPGLGGLSEPGAAPAAPPSSSLPPEPGPGAGGAPGSPEPPGPSAAPEVRHRFHDFQKPRLLSAEEVRALDTLHRKFAPSAAAALSVLVRARVQVQLSLVTQRAYFDFIRSLPNPTSLHLVYCLPQRIPFVLEMSPAVLFPCIERLLGGKGEDVPEPARPFTRIERGPAGLVAERFLAELREAWSAGADIRFDVAETEYNPLLMQVVGPSEPAVVLCFQVTLGSRTGPFHVCLPVKSFDSVLCRLTRAASPGHHGERNSGREREHILRRVSSTQVSVSAELASIPIQLADLLALRPGDVIDTQLGRRSEVAVSIEGRKLFRGLAALQQGRRAVKITRFEAED